MHIIFEQTKKKHFKKSLNIAESCMKVNGMIEALKEHVPLVLIPHAKKLLEQFIRVDMDEHKAVGVPTFVIVYTLINSCLSLYQCSCFF